jgi:hypothetical protein
MLQLVKLELLPLSHPGLLTRFTGAADMEQVKETNPASKETNLRRKAVTIKQEIAQLARFRGKKGMIF